MGVLGLWQLLGPVGQPVSLESLENKILAVDISIWLNQAVKGYRDAKGGSVANAHLLSLFSRLCKLLFYKIRPIIVFDGSAPELKKQTIINRQQRRSALKNSSNEANLKLLANFAASQGLNVGSTASQGNFVSSKSSGREDIYVLPALEEKSESFSDEIDDLDFKHDISTDDIQYVNDIDIESNDFNVLPSEIKQEILSTLKERRKHNSWEYYESLPKQSDEFSSYQMQCLLKRRRIQNKLEEVQKDVQKSHCMDIVSLYSKDDEMTGGSSRIMSDECSHYILLKKNTGNINTDAVIKETLEKASESSVISLTDDKLIESLKEEHDSMLMNEVNDAEVDDPDITTEDNSDSEIMAINEFVQKIISESEKEKSVVVKKEDFTESTHNFDINTKEDMISNNKKGNINSTTDNFEFNFSETTSKEVDSVVGKEGSVVLDFITSNTVPVNVEKASEKDLNDSSDCESFDSVPDSELSVLHQEITVSSAEHIGCENRNVPDTLVEDTSNVLKPDDIPENAELVSESFSKSSDTSAQPDSTNSELSSYTLDDDVAGIQLAVQNDLKEEIAVLQAHQAKVDRQANTVQEHMIQECKDLLKLFGVPYVVSPTEAEAQCAFYDLKEISHGTITDDSDIWLFGGKRVYKNFFAQKKFVEFYKDSEILSHFGLDRTKLINFGMLTGSDYTEGIEGVGRVTAMEIISEFGDDGIEALYQFKNWWEKVNKHPTPPKNKVCSKLQKLRLKSNFPNEHVFDAYLKPKVDDSTESFSWGRPDLDSLRDYCREKFGWKKAKVDEALQPILKKLTERMAQTHLDSFLKINLKKEKNLFPSKRIMSALKKINNQDEDADMEPVSSSVKIPRKRPAKCKTTQKSTSKGKAVSKRKNIKIKQCLDLSEESDVD